MLAKQYCHGNGSRAARRAKHNGFLRGVGLLVSAALLTSCMVTNGLETASEPDFVTNWMRTETPNAEIGKREHPLVLSKYGGEYRNEKAEAMIAEIVGRLVAVSDDKSQRYRITILNTPKVNAFALPGGYLYVTRGLLALANDSSELAGVIAHEMAHVAADHGILRNSKKRSADVGSQVVSEVLGDSVAGRLAKAANEIRLSDFSRDQELEADAIGIKLLGTAGYDAHGAVRFLKTMQMYQAYMSQRDSRFGDTSFLSSHPTTPQRIEMALRAARSFGAPLTGETGRERYLASIDGLLYGDSVEEGFVRENTFSHPGLGITFSAPGARAMENQATAVVVTGQDEIATRFDAAVLPRGMSLGAYLKSGWVKNLDETSIREETIGGLPGATAQAGSGMWRFVIRVIQVDRQVYRFITAGPQASDQVEQESASIAGSFRRLTDAEKAQLNALRISIVTVQPGESLASLSAKMEGVRSPLRLFQLLNGLSAGEIPEPGTKVKIITG